MKKLFIILIIVLPILATAQTNNYNDTIIRNDGVIIKCNIYQINTSDNIIIFNENKDGNMITNFISLDEVKYYTKPKTETKPETIKVDLKNFEQVLKEIKTIKYNNQKAGEQLKKACNNWFYSMAGMLVTSACFGISAYYQANQTKFYNPNIYKDWQTFGWISCGATIVLHISIPLNLNKSGKFLINK